MPPVKMEQAREVASRVLNVTRKPIQDIDQAVPLRAAHARMLQPLLVSHPLGPSADGRGWGDKPSQRRLGVVLGRAIDPITYAPRLKLLDMRGLLHSLWRTLRTKDAVGAEAQGPVKSDVGAIESYVRSGTAWVRAADGFIYPAAANIPQLSELGQWILSSTTNRCPRSSFKSGITGWTPEGTAVNGSAIAADSTRLLFTSTESGNSMKFTAGTPHTTALRAFIASDTQYGANTNAIIYWLYENGPGAFFEWQAKRSTDNNWWNDSTGAWGASEVFNAVPVISAPGRVVSKVVPVGGSAANITIYIRYPAAGISSGATSWVYHAQAEGDTVYPTTPILTDSASVTRSVDELTWTTNDPPHGLHVPHGTCFLRLVPAWAAADIGVANGPGAVFGWISRYDPGINRELDLLKFSSTLATFQRRADNTNADATVSISGQLREVPLVIACRWCSADGELGLAPFTCSIFANGVKGTDAVAVRTPYPSSPIKLWLGGDPGLARIGGQVSDLRFTPLVLTDAEIADISAELAVA